MKLRLASHCSTPTCQESLNKQETDTVSPRRLIQVERDACEVCKGSADRRALAEMAIAMTEGRTLPSRRCGRHGSKGRQDSRT